MNTNSTTENQKAQRIARALKGYMHHHGLSQSDLSRRTGVARDNISRYCRGVAVPAVSMATRIEKATGLKVLDMISSDPDVRPETAMTIDRLPGGNFTVYMTRELTPDQLHALLKIIEPTAPAETAKVFEEQLAFAE